MTYHLITFKVPLEMQEIDNHNFDHYFSIEDGTENF